jgi:hypothetical protein
MSATRKAPTLTRQEWEALHDLHWEIRQNPMAVSTTDLERYSDLFARSILDRQ